MTRSNPHSAFVNTLESDIASVRKRVMRPDWVVREVEKAWCGADSGDVRIVGDGVPTLEIGFFIETSLFCNNSQGW